MASENLGVEPEERFTHSRENESGRDRLNREVDEHVLNSVVIGGVDTKSTSGG